MATPKHTIYYTRPGIWARPLGAKFHLPTTRKSLSLFFLF